VLEVRLLSRHPAQLAVVSEMRKLGGVLFEVPEEGMSDVIMITYTARMRELTVSVSRSSAVPAGVLLSWLPGWPPW
jgi:hypothetical protein